MFSIKPFVSLEIISKLLNFDMNTEIERFGTLHKV